MKQGLRQAMVVLAITAVAAISGPTVAWAADGGANNNGTGVGRGNSHSSGPSRGGSNGKGGDVASADTAIDGDSLQREDPRFSGGAPGGAPRSTGLGTSRGSSQPATGPSSGEIRPGTPGGARGLGTGTRRDNGNDRDRGSGFNGCGSCAGGR